MIEEQLIQYGMAGIFILYLIYDRQILIRGLQMTINRLSEAIEGVS